MASSIPAAASGGLFQVSFSPFNINLDSEIIRDEDSGSSGAGLLASIGDVGEHGEVEVGATSLLGVGTTDYISACCW